MPKNIFIITERELCSIIEESVNVLINEGVDIDVNRNVTMTDKHENLVDTSISNNPSTSTEILPNVKVWSVFQRKQDAANSDGNPLLYALKNEKGYKLTNPMAVKNRIEYIVKKFCSSNQGIDVTIALPSTNSLNNTFASMVANNCKNPQYISNLFVKMSIEEVDDFIFEERSKFRLFYGKRFEQKYRVLQNYYKRMNDSFQFHKVQDMEMRSVIEHTIKLADDFYGEYIDKINGKNILIIDDSITLGQTVKESCQILLNNYIPSSITILTLFSPLK